MAKKDAIKILKSMRASAANKTEADMKAVCKGYDFDIWDGKNHTTYKHQKYPKLIGQWPRHRQVLPVYVRQLIRRIDELEALKGAKKND